MLFATRPMAVRVTLLAIVAALMIGALSVFVNEVTAGADSKVTVNTVSNTDDGDCGGAPNAGSGDCTFREAINAVNAGLADTINFHKDVFSKASPGVIFIDGDVTDNEGCLPTIEREVTIDSTNTGVVLDGDTNDDGTAEDCSDGTREGVIQVDANGNGFDFTFLGGKNFVIREFDGDTDGIHLDGDNIASVPVEIALSPERLQLVVPG